jgi:hypothetical protein
MIGMMTNRSVRVSRALVWRTLLALSVLLVLPASVDAAQKRTTPAVPGASGDPVWQRTVKMTDGRTFVTDGGLALDVAVAKPPALPHDALPQTTTKIFEGYMAAPVKDEYALSDLKAAATGKTYTAPSGVALNATISISCVARRPLGRFDCGQKATWIRS